MTTPYKLDLVSTYLRDAVLGGHRLGLQLQEAGLGHMKGHLHIDPNGCQLDGWGDPTICTKMAVRAVDVETTRMRTLDPSGHGRILHTMSLSGEPDVDVHLIEYARAGLWYLVVSKKDQGTAVVPLFPAASFSFSSVGTIQTRYGVPIRNLISSGDVAAMRAEADVVRRALADIDAAHTRAPGAAAPPPNTDDVRKALGELEAALAKLGG